MKKARKNLNNLKFRGRSEAKKGRPRKREIQVKEKDIEGENKVENELMMGERTSFTNPLQDETDMINDEKFHALWAEINLDPVNFQDAIKTKDKIK